MLSLHAVGDVAPRRKQPREIFASVAGELARADLRFGQLECPLSARGSPAPNAKLAMRSDPAVANVLRETGFDLMSAAGNHAMDFGAIALADTIDVCTAAGIGIAGAGATIEQARAPAIAEVAGKRVALLAYSSILPVGYMAEATRPGCAPMRAFTHFHHVEPDQPGTPPRVLTFPDSGDLAALVSDVCAARAMADIVLVSFHWGLHFIRATLADYQIVVAQAAIDAGADAILGHHPHLLKAIDTYRGKPIFYSMGNFAIEQPSAFQEDVHLHQAFKHISELNDGWQPTSKYMQPPETRHTMIARLEFDDEGGVRASFRPCRVNDDSVPILLSNGDPHFGEVVDYVTAITREAGIETHYTIDGDNVLIG